MAKLGLEKRFIQLVRLLVMGATSKIHVNGLFLNEIFVTKGWDRDAPCLHQSLLFPLKCLWIIGPFARTQHLQGIWISEELTISYCLFADDMGLFIIALESAFREVTEAISLYELASRAKLNMAISIIILFNVPNIPLWLLNLGVSWVSQELFTDIWGPLGAMGLLRQICLIFAWQESTSNYGLGPVIHSRSWVEHSWLDMFYKLSPFIIWCLRN